MSEIVSKNHCHCHCHTRFANDRQEGKTKDNCQNEMMLSEFRAPLFSFVMLVSGMIMHYAGVAFFNHHDIISLIWYLAAFIPVGLPILKEALESIVRKDVFNEFLLMSIACIGAFCIGEYPEAVGVMLFYCIGETLQDKAIDKATRDITRLISSKEIKAHLIRNGVCEDVDPKSVVPGSILEVYPGERVPLDGILLTEKAIIDASALTGESMPVSLETGNEILSGMISLEAPIRIRVKREYSKSMLARLMEMVKDAAERKAPTELFIRKFARIYTPVVFVLAILVVAVPFIISLFHTEFSYSFSTWLNRALVFLVISCPCALVISVPLGYFAGIGKASRLGILFKGGNYLDLLAKLKAIAFDKTGTLTTGKFTVKEIRSYGIDDNELLSVIASVESVSSHPLAVTVVNYARSIKTDLTAVSGIKEIAGYGIKAIIFNRRVAVGNKKMMDKVGITLPDEVLELAVKSVDTFIFCGIDGKFAGYVTLSDTLKPDAKSSVEQLKKLGVRDIVMLSGDRTEIARTFASQLGIKSALGALLPEDKVAHIEEMKKEENGVVGFVGDGMNDSPVLAVSDVGIAMGGMGSDMAVEAADVVIQTDSPSKIAAAVRIGRFTRKVVRENIIGAISCKLAILVLGLLGIATLWAAVFADVGVALLAVVNSMRILSYRAE